MKRDWSGVMFGVVVGLSIGLLLCNVVHASTEASCSDIVGVSSGCSFDDGIFPEKLTGGDIWGAGYNGQLRIVEVFPLCHGGEVDPLCYDADAHHFVTSCQVQMEAAMRAMDEFVYREPSMTTPAIADMCIYDAVCMATRELARVSRRTDAAKQWEQAKACWRKP